MIGPKTPKDNGFRTDPQASEFFLREIDAFRRRRRFNAFTKVRPFITYLATYKGKKQDFSDFVEQMESFRCSLGMSTSRFYKIAAEFVLAPGGRHYYTPQRLFDSISYEYEEFRDRLLAVLGNISHVVELRDNEDEVHSFARKIESVSRILDTGCNRASKDWFCLSEVLRYVKTRGWSTADFHKRLKTFYQRRQRKVYPENLLMDIVIHRDLDNITTSPKGGSKNKTDIAESIRKEPWFDDWQKQIEDKQRKDESGEEITEEDERVIKGL